MKLCKILLRRVQHSAFGREEARNAFTFASRSSRAGLVLRIFISLSLVLAVTIAGKVAASGNNRVQFPAAFELQIPGETVEDDFVIRNASVFDGEALHRQTDVWVKGGYIRAVGGKLSVDSAIREVDGTGSTVLPGLIDSHTHTWGDALRQALMFGVTTEVDMYSDPNFDNLMRQREASGKNMEWADLRSAGTLVTVAGGHGTEYGLSIPVLKSQPEAQEFVDARITEGSDFIKIIYDDRSTSQGRLPTLTRAEVEAVIKAAHARRKLAVAHIATRRGAEDVVEAKVDGLAHIFADQPISQKLLTSIKRHRTFVIATLTILEASSGHGNDLLLKDPRLAPYISPATKTNLAALLRSPHADRIKMENAFSTVKALHRAGVAILVGTDCPNPGTAHGVSIHREMELLVQSGMKPMEALVAATSLPAKIFGLTDRGRIVPGKRADLLMVRGDPARDITATRNIISIWKFGRQADRGAFRAEIARATAEDSALRKVPPPPGSESGLVSDFENGKIDASFGAGWSISTDEIAGGKSTAEMDIVYPGAHGSGQSLQIQGNISGQLSFAWAGALFSPGPKLFAPANFSGKHFIRFWARGDGRRYVVLVYTKSGGYIPFRQAFQPAKEWGQFEFPIASFGGSDGHDITGILISPSAEPGTFVFGLDDLSID